MARVALRASLQVRAGIIPGTAIEQYGRAWHYTSADYEADAALPQEQPTKFVRLREEALDYVRRTIDPARLNWVELTWIWY